MNKSGITLLYISKQGYSFIKVSAAFVLLVSRTKFIGVCQIFECLQFVSNNENSIAVLSLTWRVL